MKSTNQESKTCDIRTTRRARSNFPSRNIRRKVGEIGKAAAKSSAQLLQTTRKSILGSCDKKPQGWALDAGPKWRWNFTLLFWGISPDSWLDQGNTPRFLGEIFVTQKTLQLDGKKWGTMNTNLDGRNILNEYDSLGKRWLQQILHISFTQTPNNN